MVRSLPTDCIRKHCFSTQPHNKSNKETFYSQGTERSHTLNLILTILAFIFVLHSLLCFISYSLKWNLFATKPKNGACILHEFDLWYCSMAELVPQMLVHCILIKFTWFILTHLLCLILCNIWRGRFWCTY